MVDQLPKERCHPAAQITFGNPIEEDCEPSPERPQARTIGTKARMSLISIDTCTTLPEQWDELASSCSWGTFYHCAGNVRLVAEEVPASTTCITATVDGNLVGGLAIAQVDGPLGPVLNSLPYFGSYGDAIIAPQASPQVHQALYEALVEHAHKVDALSLTIITSPFADEAHHAQVEQVLAPDYKDERCCQYVNLPKYNGHAPDEYFDEIFNSVQGRARTAYRKAAKCDFIQGLVESSDEAQTFGNIHRANIEGKGGLFKSADFFQNAFSMQQNGIAGAELAVARDEQGTIAGGAIFFSFNGIAEYHTVCLNDEHRSSGVLNKLIIDKMVEYGQNGIRCFNFGGTWASQTGVRKFKESFGAVAVPYWYFTRFFRDASRVKAMAPEEVLDAYPNTYVIPFSELS